MSWNEINEFLTASLPYTATAFIALTIFIEYKKYKKHKSVNGK